MKDRSLPARYHKALYLLGAGSLLLQRLFVDATMWANEILLFGALDHTLEGLSRAYNHSLIRFQLERIDKGLVTGLKLQSFDMGHGCWIATVRLEAEIVQDPRAVDFVQDVVAYTTHANKKNIMATFISESSVRIVVSDARID